jgi:hypothetical protein
MPDPESVADTVRRAAALLRKLAEAVAPGPWYSTDQVGGQWSVRYARDWSIAYTGDDDEPSRANAEFIATVHPAVALLIADSWDAAVVEMAHWNAYEEDGRVLQCLIGVRRDWTATLAAARAVLRQAS